MIITAEDYIEHFGVKGMRWGVRRDRRANTHIKVGAGQGTLSDKVRSGLTVGPVDLVKGRGFKGAAARKGLRQLERNERVRNGESTVKDKLLYIGGTKYQDILPTGKSSVNTKAAIGASVVGAIIVNQALGIGIRAIRSNYD